MVIKLPINQLLMIKMYKGWILFIKDLNLMLDSCLSYF